MCSESTMMSMWGRRDTSNRMPIPPFLSNRLVREKSSRPASVLKNLLLRLPAVGDNASMQSEPSKTDIPKYKRRWFRFSLRTGLVALLVVVAFVVGFAAYCVYDVVCVIVPDCYAQEWVAELVVEHMKENDGRWPRDWDDLAKPYRVLSREREIPWTLDELRRRVALRFDVDPKILRSAVAIDEQPPFSVIRLRSGLSHNWQGREPNRIVWDHLNAASK
jgi:hypothetical protein